MRSQLDKFSYRNLRIYEREKNILRKTLGIPLYFPPHLSIEKLKFLISDFHPPKIVTVGDIVTLNLIKNSVYPDIAVVDLMSKRRKAECFISFYKKVYSEMFFLDNPPSTISKNVWKFQSLFKKKHKILIIIRGEEDLLVIPFSIMAPMKSFIVYGQPDEAMIIIVINHYIRNTFINFLSNL